MSKKTFVEKSKDQPLTDEQKAIAKPILDAFNNMCLMSGFIPGVDKPVAVVCAFQMQPDRSMMFYPRFVVVTDDMFDLIKPPSETEIVKLQE